MARQTKAYLADRTKYIDIKWQEGVVPEVGINGADTEDVIIQCIVRLEAFQKGNHPCPENDSAIKHLNKAKAYLDQRTGRRTRIGWEGTEWGS